MGRGNLLLRGLPVRVSEIFVSFQGEGREQGKRCTFLRLAGCNLACRWCDTPATQDPAGGEERSADAILDEIRSPGVRRICITGGEPLLQADELLPLLMDLAGEGYKIDIETNGTVPFGPVLPWATICMDIKCPSSGEESDLSLLPLIRPADTVKFVVADQGDLDYAAGILREHPIAGEVIISPVHGADYHAVAQEIIGWTHDIRLQLQLHKQIGMR
nr:radical SAM protein [Methanocalculus alkaliphilus]